MKTCLIKRLFVLSFALCILTSCASRNSSPKQIVPITISIQNNEPQLSSINFDIYTFRVLDRLRSFSPVQLELSDNADSAIVNLSISIDRYTQFPSEQRTSSQVYRRTIQIGTDQSGKPIYQTVAAVADIVRSRIRTSALFTTSLTIKGNPGKKFNRTFSENLNFDNVFVSNIRGDSRAVDPSLYTATMPPMDPTEDDILIALSNREMLDRLSREIRNYYDKK